MPQPIWITPTGVVNQTIYDLGNFATGIILDINLEAQAIVPAVSVTYKLISGNLPAGTSLSETGIIHEESAIGHQSVGDAVARH